MKCVICKGAHKAAECPDKKKCHCCHRAGLLAEDCTNAWGAAPPDVSHDPLHVVLAMPHLLLPVLWLGIPLLPLVVQEVFQWQLQVPLVLPLLPRLLCLSLLPLPQRKLWMRPPSSFSGVIFLPRFLCGYWEFLCLSGYPAH